MRVLLAVDGSEFSSRATEAVRSLASVTSLTVLHVVDLPRLTYPMLGPEIAKDLAMTVEQAMRAEGNQVLSRTLSRLSYHTFPVDKRLEEGVPAEMICSVAQEVQADLTVMGARGVGQIQELVLGSVSHWVLTHAPCPVLVIKAPLKEIKKILLPLQDLEDMERVKRLLATHPFHAEVEIIVFTVVPIPRSIFRAGVSAPESEVQKALESAEAFIDKTVGELKSTSYAVTGLVGMGAPAEIILEQEAETKPDLVLMGSHHPSAISRVVLGSVSHTVLHRSNSPVLLLR
jgi:nucleotide-binding universal stress UspA family protein